MSFGNPVGENIYAAGQPSREELRGLPASGVKRVIDLRPSSEDRGFDEAKEAAAAGIEYLNLPIAGEADLTPANVRRFDAWLGGPGRPATLVHCGSSNRVGALIALRAGWIKGKNSDAALSEGRSAGLKGMENAVRTALGKGPPAQA